MSLLERVQAGIYTLEEGAGRVFLRGLCLWLVFVLVLALMAAGQYRGLRTESAMEWSQLGRAVAEGQGLSTRVWRPADLSVWQARGLAVDPAAGLPDLRHPPLYPLVLGAAFRVLPDGGEAAGIHRYAPERRVVLPLAALLLGVCGVIMAVLGRAVFGPVVAFAALVALLFNRAALEAVLAGGSRPLEMGITTLTFGLAFWAGRQRARRGPVWTWLPTVVGAGAAGGLAVLTGYGLVAVTLAAAVLLGSGFVRWRGPVVALFLVTAALVMAPWVARNLRVSDLPLGLAPYAALEGSVIDADGQLDRRPYQSPRGREVWTALRLKTMDTLAHAGERFPVTGAGLVMAFFLVAFLVRLEPDGAESLKWAVLLALALRLLLAAAGPPAPDVWLPLLPLVTLLAAALAVQMLGQATTLLPEVRQVLVWLWIGAALLPTLFALAGAGPRPAYPPYAPAFTRYVCGLLEPGEVLATDIPAAAAWHGRQTALKLPPTPAALVGLAREGLPIGGLYLTTQTGDQPYTSGLRQGPERGWLPLLDHQVPEGFPWPHGFALPPGERDQLFLTDRPRWAPDL